MAILARRPPSSWGDMLEWLESGPTLALKGLTQGIRVEDFVEDSTYVLRAELPGVDPDKDIEVNVDADVLTIHGERRDEEHDNAHSEVRYGSFTRSVRLPKGADPSDVTARYDAGVLVVSVPMTEAPPQPTKVTVQRTGDTS